MAVLHRAIAGILVVLGAIATIPGAGTAQSRAKNFTTGDSIRNLREAQLAIRRYWSVAHGFWGVHASPMSHIEGLCEQVVGKYCHGPTNGRFAFGAKANTMPVEFMMSDDAIISRKRSVMRTTFNDAMKKLDRAQADAPGDRYIVGQRVFHRVERGDLNGAARVAGDCRSDGWWCAALVGYTKHLLSLHAAADSAFERALATAPDSLRCAWENLDLLVADDSLNSWYRSLDCARRAELNRTVWWLSDPLFIVPGNERRAAHFFRVVHATLARDAEWRLEPHVEEGLNEPAYPPHGPAYTWAVIRMGVPSYLAFSPSRGAIEAALQEPPSLPMPGSGGTLPSPGSGGLNLGRGRPDPPMLILQYRQPFYHFIPALSAARSPKSATVNDWTPNAQPTPEHFRAAFGALSQPEHQLAWFRRGPWAQVIAGFDIAGDTLLQNGGLVGGGLVLVSAPDQKPRIVPQQRGAPWTFSATRVLPETTIVSLEAISAGVGAGRVRYASGPPPMPAQRVTLSDVVLLVSAEPLPTTLDAAARRIAQNTRVPKGSVAGLYWEVYGLEPDDSVTVSLAAAGRYDSGLEALTGQLGLTGIDRTAVRWNERRIGLDGISGQSIALDVRSLRTGSYTLELRVEVPGQQPVAVKREISIVEP